MKCLACPKCKLPLIQIGPSFKCAASHTYDLAKKGYLNVLLNPDKSTNHPGDSKESLIARKAFLNKGYYDGISHQVIDIIQQYRPGPLSILDLGCGEGYYTYRMKQHMPEHDYYGLDISKEAIMMATRYDPSICWLVGNSKNLPILDHQLDVICALFTVVNKDEIARCLKKEGIMIHVTANAHHLIELKKQIYDEIKIKSDQYLKLPFPILSSKDYIQKVHIQSREDTLNLLKMTPHYYHIKQDKRDILNTLDSLDITIDIKITVYTL